MKKTMMDRCSRERTWTIILRSFSGSIPSNWTILVGNRISRGWKRDWMTYRRHLTPPIRRKGRLQLRIRCFRQHTKHSPKVLTGRVFSKSPVPWRGSSEIFPCRSSNHHNFSSRTKVFILHSSQCKHKFLHSLHPLWLPINDLWKEMKPNHCFFLHFLPSILPIDFFLCTHFQCLILVFALFVSLLISFFFAHSPSYWKK